MADRGPRVIVLLPGLGGSTLFDSKGEQIWPGDLFDLFHYPEQKLKQLINDPLTARDIMRSIIGIPIYQSLVDFLGKQGFTEKAGNLRVFPYDWRQDLVATAGRLADQIVQICANYAGSCSVTLLAHSTGGLIARCLIESGEFDDRLGAARTSIRQLIMMGTAGRGAPEALGGITGLEGLLFLSANQAARLAAARNYPAAYQHLPAPGATALWDRTSLFPRDLYETEVARKLGLDPGHLACAVDFWSKLAFPLPASAGPRYFGFVGTRQSTLTGYGYDAAASEAAALIPQETEDGGDGTVPIWSAGQSELQVHYVGGSHATLFADADLKTTLLQLIPMGPKATIKLDRFEAEVSRTIDLSTRHLVPRARGGTKGLLAPLIVSLRIGAAATPVGEIVVELKEAPRPGDKSGQPWHSQTFMELTKIPIQFRGPPPARHGVPIGDIAAFEAGHYRAYFLAKGAKTTAGQCAEFIIPAKPNPARTSGRAMQARRSAPAKKPPGRRGR